MSGPHQSAGEAGEPIVEFEDVSFAYPNAEGPALEGVSLRVRRGQRLGILGPNGGGKSTLLKLALGLLSPSSGRVRVLGRDPGEARALGLVGYVPQKTTAELGFPLTVTQVATMAAAWRVPAWRPVPGAVRERVREMLDLVGVADLAQRAIGGLSGGQLQRVMIARALLAAPRGEGAGGGAMRAPALLALDEPMVGIDAVGQARFAELLQRVHRELGVTILIVSHDLRAIAAGCDEVACLARRLHYHASPTGLTPRVLAEVFSHDVAGIAGLAGMHIHAHGPGEACPDTGPVGLSVSAPRGGARGGAGGGAGGGS